MMPRTIAIGIQMTKPTSSAVNNMMDIAVRTAISIAREQVFEKARYAADLWEE